MAGDSKNDPPMEAAGSTARVIILNHPGQIGPAMHLCWAAAQLILLADLLRCRRGSMVVLGKSCNMAWSLLTLVMLP